MLGALDDRRSARARPGLPSAQSRSAERRASLSTSLPDELAHARIGRRELERVREVLRERATLAPAGPPIRRVPPATARPCATRRRECVEPIVVPLDERHTKHPRRERPPAEGRLGPRPAVRRESQCPQAGRDAAHRRGTRDVEPQRHVLLVVHVADQRTARRAAAHADGDREARRPRQPEVERRTTQSFHPLNVGRRPDVHAASRPQRLRPCTPRGRRRGHRPRSVAAPVVQRHRRTLSPSRRRPGGTACSRTRYVVVVRRSPKKVCRSSLTLCVQPSRADADAPDRVAALQHVPAQPDAAEVGGDGDRRRLRVPVRSRRLAHRSARTRPCRTRRRRRGPETPRSPAS